MDDKEFRKMVRLLTQCRDLHEEIEQVLIEEFGEEDYKRLKRLLSAMQKAIYLASHNTLKGRENAYKRLTKLREEVRLWLGR